MFRSILQPKSLPQPTKPLNLTGPQTNHRLPALTQPPPPLTQLIGGAPARAHIGPIAEAHSARRGGPITRVRALELAALRRQRPRVLLDARQAGGRGAALQLRGRGRRRAQHGRQAGAAAAARPEEAPAAAVGRRRRGARVRRRVLAGGEAAGGRARVGGGWWWCGSGGSGLDGALGAQLLARERRRGRHRLGAGQRRRRIYVRVVFAG